MWLTRNNNNETANYFNSYVPAPFRAFEEDSVVWSPRVDVEENLESVIVKADLPGVDKKNLSVNLKDNLLTIRAERKCEKESKGKNYYRSERAFGIFQRTFELTEKFKAEAIKAEYKDGVLTVTLPKADEVKPREISIN
ncbi:MAG TPA: Hsp20/alpha crystallin family protein [bacterium]|nr:Hsp20/alpha crystallin family protein [bacterium]HPN35162.1 Hsp20/alpha crystallin family protein [bacterium]